MTITISSWWASNIGRDRRDRDPVHPDEPQPGYYRTRWRRDGPWVAARIWSDPTGTYCKIGDHSADPFGHWLYMEPISISDWKRLEALRAADPNFSRYDQPYDLLKGVMKP